MSQEETSEEQDEQPHSKLQDWDEWFSESTDESVMTID